MQVAHNTIVSLRYCMKNSSGDVLENRLGGNPVEYLHGSSGIMPALQNGLTGLQAGDNKHISIASEPGFLLDANFYFDVVIDGVREATEDEIMNGKPAKAVVAQEECGPGCDC